MGRMSVATAGKKAPWSLPFKRCIAHLTHTDRWTCLLFKVKTKFCQMSIGMPQVTLHILDASVVLHVRGRGAPECLMGQILDPNLLRQWFQTPLQIVANAERRSGRIWKEEGARIIAFWVPRNPRFNLRSEIGLHGHVVVALLCLCCADPI